jgi:hypothetical protein
MALPKSITVQELPDRLIITEHSDPWMKFLVIPVLGAITLLPVAIPLFSSKPSHPNVTALVILAIPFGAFWYWLAAESFNSITVTVSADAITRRGGPIPLPPARYAAGTIRVSELERIYITRGRRMVSGSGTFYNLKTRTKNGRRLIITAGHNDSETVVTLGRMVKERLPTVKVWLEVPN